ncbi:aromatic acid exporter family protein [Longirhabdus pacifica]|uniref:aromatic acid exporter family protein n=1 Tax=Longirhabdus pacifica TaxID=2305227 RepID=UPI0010087083|nr:aromatic acid exporter family protein [Longirhabdus pacifica]
MGIRTLKTAIAVLIAVYLAYWLDLHYIMSAALLAILGVDVTKKKTFLSSFVRMAASILGMSIAIVIFAVLGFHLWVIPIFIFTAIAVLVKLKLQSGIVTSTVIVLHLVEQQSLALAAIGNEVMLLIVGLGSAMIVNLIYMPDAEDDLQQHKHDLEDLFSVIFSKMVNQLEHPNEVWSGEELLQAEGILHEAKHIVENQSENMLFKSNTAWATYFHMREQQLQSIKRMMRLVSHVYHLYTHNKMIAELLSELSEDVKNEFYTGNVEKKLGELEQKFKGMTLPLTREEFEVRSALLQLILELEHYIFYAKESKKKKKIMPSSKSL